MSLFNWFGKRSTPADATHSQHSGLGHSDTTLPNHHAVQPPAARPQDASQRRSERVERRELLYGVVRECMNAAGVLSASYKFKVLSLDPSGRKYLIMMDVPRVYLADPAQFSVIEGAIARSAKERYDMLVTAVYWRVNDLVSTAAQHAPGPPVAAALPPKARPSPVTAPAPASPARPAPGELRVEEMQAFKRAVAAAARGSAPVVQGQVVHSGPLHAASEPDFSDTQPFENFAPLGTSQFGGLN